MAYGTKQKKTEPIIVSVIGGVVEEVVNIPAGQTVIVRDYDAVEDADPAVVETDAEGDKYVPAVWP